MTYQERALVLVEEFLPYMLKEETICSLAIERIRVELEELGEDKPSEPRLRQAWNYYHTAKEIYSIALKGAGKEEIITEPLILWAYEKLWEGFNVPKGYRDTEMTIMGARFEPPRPEVVPKLMKRIIEYLKSCRLPPVRKGAVFHLLFEVIHPFTDGNGRLGRILLNAILIEGGLLNIAFRDRDSYISALRSAEEGAVVVVDKLARGRKLTGEQITETVLEYGDVEEFEELVRRELLHSLEVYAREKEILLTPSQVAQLLGFKNTDYVRVLVHRGVLTGVKMRNFWYVPLSEAIAYAKKRNMGVEKLVRLLELH